MSKDNSKYEVLRQLAVAGAAGMDGMASAQTALEQAAALVGLSAAALHLWDEKGKPTLAAVHEVSEVDRQRLQTLEEELYAGLRREKQLESAYLSFAGNPPSHSFTLPLRRGAQVFGAVIGLQEGVRTIISEDLFLEALCALLSLNFAAAGLTRAVSVDQKSLNAAKVEGIHETAVTANHEINNALTPILGNADVLKKHRGLDEDLKKKIMQIEESALRISSVLRRLMRVDKPDSVVYYDNIKMIPLPPEEDSDTT